jgi:hypothetical protein
MASLTRYRSNFLKAATFMWETIITHQFQPFYTLVKFLNTHFLIPLGMEAFPPAPNTFVSQTQRRMRPYP